jgi:hypothetical protein
MSYVRALRGLDIRWQLHQIRVAFRLWWWKATHVVGTPSERTSFMDFLDAWYGCHTPQGRLDLTRLLKSAAATMPAAGLPAKAQTLLRCCGVLQQVNGGSFYLSNEDASQLVGCGPERGRTALRRLTRAGLIEVIEVGSNYKGRASTSRGLFRTSG